MTEKDFRVQLEKGLRAQGWFCWKIPDLSRAIVKPFDICASYERQFAPIECKLTKITAKRGPTAATVVLRRANFQPQQIPTLLSLYEKRHGKPWIAVCLLWSAELGKTHKRAWMIPAQVYLDEALDRITLGDLEKAGHELVWKPGLGWVVPWLPEPWGY